MDIFNKTDDCSETRQSEIQSKHSPPRKELSNPCLQDRRSCGMSFQSSHLSNKVYPPALISIPRTHDLETVHSESYLPRQSISEPVKSDTDPTTQCTHSLPRSSTDIAANANIFHSFISKHDKEYQGNIRYRQIGQPEWSHSASKWPREESNPRKIKHIADFLVDEEKSCTTGARADTMHLSELDPMEKPERGAKALKVGTAQCSLPIRIDGSKIARSV